MRRDIWDGFDLNQSKSRVFHRNMNGVCNFQFWMSVLCAWKCLGSELPITTKLRFVIHISSLVGNTEVSLHVDSKHIHTNS